MSLSSGDIEALCDKIVHGDQERFVSDMTDAAIDALMRAADGDGGTMKAEAALEKLAREFPERARSIMAEHSGVISGEVRAAVSVALEGSAAADMSELAAFYGKRKAKEADGRLHGATMHFHRQAQAVADGVAQSVRRNNVDMEEAAEKAWHEAAADAAQAVALGTMPREEAVARAVERLADQVGKVRYASGAEANVDVAVRRQIVTQCAQAGGRMTLDAMAAYGHKLIVTDAHFGARPSHAAWQGKPACVDGTAVVDGTRYPSLAKLTGYGTAQGLHGANCKHHISPYYPGITQLPDRSFAAERERFGMGPDDYYEATQRQRSMERSIRRTKREIVAMEKAGVGLESSVYVQKRLVLGRQQQRMRKHCEANGLQRMPEREKAYGVSKQPRALTGEKWKGERGISKKKNALEGAKVDLKLIASKEYASAFKGLTGNDAADKAILQAARTMLTHRSGTYGEDLYLVSIVDGEVKASVTDSKEYLAVTPTSDILDAVSSNPEGTLFSVHNHPSNIPPTGSDLSVSASRKYAGAIVALHDGGVYYYKHGNVPFPPRLFDMECQKRIDSGKSEADAIIETFDEFRREYGVKWRRIR